MQSHQPVQTLRLFWRLGVRLLSAALLLLPLVAGSVGTALAGGDLGGAVYALTNNPAGNAVLVYGRGADGSLRRPVRSRPAALEAAPDSDRRMR